MAGNGAPDEGRWSRIRGGLISFALVVALAIFLRRLWYDPDPTPWAPLDFDLAAFVVLLIPAMIVLAPAALWASLVLKVRRWPTTAGVVEAAHVRVRGSGFGSTARGHYPIVRYRYTVEGVERIGHVLSHGYVAGGGRGWAEAVIARYPVGATVEVRYDPRKPEDTALEARFGGIGWLLFGVGGALLLAAMFASGLL
jgi:hypothetical protein